MAIYSIPNNGGAAAAGSELGTSIGQGLSSGLQQLAQNKMQTMQKRNSAQKLKQAFPELPDEAVGWINELPAKEQIEVLQQVAQKHQQGSTQAQEQPMTLDSVTPEQKDMLREYLSSPEAAQGHAPEELQKIAKFLEGPAQQGGLQELQQNLGNNPVGVNPFTKEQPGMNTLQAQAAPVRQPPAAKGGILSALAKGSSNTIAREKQDLAREKFEFEKQQAKEKAKEEEISPAQKKNQEEVQSAYGTYEDLLETSKRMLENIQKNDIAVGFIPSIKYGISPTSLDTNSEDFAKDSDHIVNLASSGLKGVMSKYRVQKLESEKPSLRHSKKVNENILKRYIQLAENKIKQIEKDNPKIEFTRTDTPEKPEDAQEGETFNYDNGEVWQWKNGKFSKIEG